MLDELDCFACEMSESTGTVKYSAPQNKHDDCICSLGLAVWDLNDTKISIPIPQPKIDNTPKQFIQRKYRLPVR